MRQNQLTHHIYLPFQYWHESFEFGTCIYCDIRRAKKGRGNISWQWGYLTGNILTVRSMVHYSSCFVRLITEFDNYCKYNKPGLNKYITIQHFDICSV